MTTPTLPKPPAAKLPQRSYITALALAHELTKEWPLAAAARIQVEGMLAGYFWNEMPGVEFLALLANEPAPDSIKDAVAKFQGLEK